MYNTLYFDQNRRFTILLNIFWFSANNSKMISKFEKSFPLVSRGRRDKAIDVYYQKFRIKTKASYSFEIVVQTGRRNLFRNVLIKDLSNDIGHAYQSGKLVSDEENNIATSSVILGEG